MPRPSSSAIAVHPRLLLTNPASVFRSMGSVIVASRASIVAIRRTRARPGGAPSDTGGVTQRLSKRRNRGSKPKPSKLPAIVTYQWVVSGLLNLWLYRNALIYNDSEQFRGFGLRPLSGPT
jgi:hypothetical protein